jgi:hypothetical protein
MFKYRCCTTGSSARPFIEIILPYKNNLRVLSWKLFFPIKIILPSISFTYIVDQRFTELYKY